LHAKITKALRHDEVKVEKDEIAVASCLAGMDAYVDGNTDIYSLTEAAQDHYINLLVEQALASKQVVEITTQPWSR
jgi:hypothetical protein